MSWLDEIIGERLKNLPEDAFTDRTFGFGDIKRVVDLVEKAVDRNATETTEAGRDRAQKAAANPFHDFARNPVFAPMGVELWKASTTFPRILRSALLVATYSHTEFLPALNSSVKARRARRPFPGLSVFSDILGIVPAFRKMSTEADQAQATSSRPIASRP